MQLIKNLKKNKSLLVLGKELDVKFEEMIN